MRKLNEGKKKSGHAGLLDLRTGFPLSIESEEVRTQTLLKRRRARGANSKSSPLPSKCFG